MHYAVIKVVSSMKRNALEREFYIRYLKIAPNR